MGTAPPEKSGHTCAIVQKNVRSPRRNLFALAEWEAEDTDVPDGDWFKDFGTFKLCGTGRFPSTVFVGGADSPREAAVAVTTRLLLSLSSKPNRSRKLRTMRPEMRCPHVPFADITFSGSGGCSAPVVGGNTVPARFRVAEHPGMTGKGYADS